MLGTAALRTKSPEAFRTISEVAGELDVPQHVLRFWEGRFAQIKPVKRAGGRRYYRPEDVDLLRGIRSLLYGDGFTIKGVQKILRDKGVRHVAELGRCAEPAPVPHIAEPRSNVIALERLAEAMREPVRVEETAVVDETIPMGVTLPVEAVDVADEASPAGDAAAPAGPVEIEQPAALAEVDQVRLEILLAELLQMKARLTQLRRQADLDESPRNVA